MGETKTDSGRAYEVGNLQIEGVLLAHGDQEQKEPRQLVQPGG